MIVTSTPQSARGSPEMRSRSNSLPNTYMNNIHVTIPKNKKRSTTMTSHVGQSKKKGMKSSHKGNKGNSLLHMHNHNNSFDSQASNHKSSDSLSTRAITLAHSLNMRRHNSGNEAYKMKAVREKRVEFTPIGQSEGPDYRDFNSSRTSHL